MTDPTAQPAYSPRVGDRIIIRGCTGYGSRHNGCEAVIEAVYVRVRLADGSEDGCLTDAWSAAEPQRAEEPEIPRLHS